LVGTLYRWGPFDCGLKRRRAGYSPINACRPVRRQCPWRIGDGKVSQTLNPSGSAIGLRLLHMWRTMCGLWMEPWKKSGHTKFIEGLSLPSKCVTWCLKSLQFSSAKGEMDCTLDLVSHEDLKEECGSFMGLGDQAQTKPSWANDYRHRTFCSDFMPRSQS